MTEAAQKAVKETQKPETFAAKAYAAHSAAAPLAPFTLPRRSPRPQDVQIEILFCGVCHSDLHQINNDWFPGIFPMVPGHEQASARLTPDGGLPEADAMHLERRMNGRIWLKLQPIVDDKGPGVDGGVITDTRVDGATDVVVTPPA